MLSTVFTRAAHYLLPLTKAASGIKRVRLLQLYNVDTIAYSLFVWSSLSNMLLPTILSLLKVYFKILEN